ncbi:MAG TPA: peptidoglycan-binding protein LysM [Woeseiaceae bacterium]|nr:peptidoglycan-binding protein LysM [Woeseiaceae bacterium]
MGLFDFVKDAGAQLFNTDAEAARNIKQHLEVKTSGIKNIDVKFDDGVATISGDCINQATRDSAVLMVGNIKGVKKVVADKLTVPAPAAKAPPELEEKIEYYTIAKGDTLSAVAKRYYGNASQYVRIFEANKDIIENPDKIFPGQKIRIPLD